MTVCMGYPAMTLQGRAGKRRWKGVGSPCRENGTQNLKSRWYEKPEPVVPILPWNSFHKLSQREATIIRGTPTEALPTVVSTWREEKLNGKPDDSADIYENSELLSKVAENNFSTAATSKIQTADPLSENRPFISSGKRSTELQTIRQLGEKMATVDHVADAEGMFTEINGASESFMFRIDQCFARYPDFLANVELEAKVIATLQKAEDYILHLKEQHHQHLLEATNRQ